MSRGHETCAEVVVSYGEFRVVSHCGAKMEDGLFMVVPGLQDQSQLVVRGRVAGLDLDGFSIVRFRPGLVLSFQLLLAQSAGDVRGRALRMTLDAFSVRGHGGFNSEPGIRRLNRRSKRGMGEEGCLEHPRAKVGQYCRVGQALLNCLVE